jgi:hypothetical protein
VLHPETDHEQDSDGRVGIAIGIVSAAINAGLAFSSLMIGYFLDSKDDTQTTTHSFVSLQLTGAHYVQTDQNKYADSI